MFLLSLAARARILLTKLPNLSAKPQVNGNMQEIDLGALSTRYESEAKVPYLSNQLITLSKHYSIFKQSPILPQTWADST